MIKKYMLEDFNNRLEMLDCINRLAEENDGLKQDIAHWKVLYHSLQDKYSGLLRLVYGDDEK